MACFNYHPSLDWAGHVLSVELDVEPAADADAGRPDEQFVSNTLWYRDEHRNQPGRGDRLLVEVEGGLDQQAVIAAAEREGGVGHVHRPRRAAVAGERPDGGRGGARAETLLREALPHQRRVLGEHDPVTGSTHYALGHVLQETGRLPEAESQYRQALAAFRAALGDHHDHTLLVWQNLASVMDKQGRPGEAVATLREVLRQQPQNAAGDSMRVRLVKISLANMLLAADPEAAIKVFEEVFAERNVPWPQQNPSVRAAAGHFADLLEKAERHADAKRVRAQFVEAVALHRRRVTVGGSVAPPSDQVRARCRRKREEKRRGGNMHSRKRETPPEAGFTLEWAEPGSIRRHMDFQSIALPAELSARRSPSCCWRCRRGPGG